MGQEGLRPAIGIPIDHFTRQTRRLVMEEQPNGKRDHGQDEKKRITGAQVQGREKQKNGRHETPLREPARPCGRGHALIVLCMEDRPSGPFWLTCGSSAGLAQGAMRDGKRRMCRRRTGGYRGDQPCAGIG